MNDQQDYVSESDNSKLGRFHIQIEKKAPNAIGGTSEQFVGKIKRSTAGWDSISQDDVKVFFGIVVVLVVIIYGPQAPPLLALAVMLFVIYYLLRRILHCLLQVIVTLLYGIAAFSKLLLFLPLWVLKSLWWLLKWMWGMVDMIWSWLAKLYYLVYQTWATLFYLVSKLMLILRKLSE